MVLKIQSSVVMIICQCLQLGTCRLCGLMSVNVHGASPASVLLFGVPKVALCCGLRWKSGGETQFCIYYFQSVKKHEYKHRI